MHPRLHAAYTFGDTVTRGNDQVESAQIKRLDGGRKKRQVIPITPENTRKTLNRRCADLVSGDPGRKLSFLVKKRMDHSVRVKLAQRLETLFAAAHAVEPVVRKRGLQLNTRS